MPAYSFKSNFVPAIIALTKNGTIRNKRSRPTKVGDRLYLYENQRTKNSRKIGEATCCLVVNIKICGSCVVEWVTNGKRYTHTYRGAELEQFAIADGFLNWDGMRRWWTIVHGELPWEGEHIYWEDFKPEPQ